jgi:diguanylate cyclase (GGDEF)-like protein/PAS domain S-box-containing protein
MKRIVLLVEDSPGDVRLTLEAFSDAATVIDLRVAADGVDAMAFLRREGAHADAPRPDLILLDLHLPKKNGRQVLAEIKQDDDLKTIPTVILTTSSADADIEAVYQLRGELLPNQAGRVRCVRWPGQEHQRFLADKGQTAADTIRMRKSIKIVLLVEDNPGDARLMREVYNEHGPPDTELIHVASMNEAETYLVEHPVDIVLLDVGLSDARGLETVRRARIAAPHVALVVLTGLDDESLAAQSLQEGAQDYLVKGQSNTNGSSHGLLRALRYAIERKALEEALFVEKERAQVTLNSIGDAVICTDIAGNVNFLNVVAEKLTGWTRQAAAGQPMAEVFRVLDDGEVTSNLAMIDQNDVDRVPSNRCLLRGDGLVVPIEDCVAPIHDRKGLVTGTVIVFRDVSAARAMAKQISYSAQHDFLTGLPNRMLLNDRIGQAIALSRRSMSKIAVLFLDLDGFKYINDSLGHPLGDKLLQSIAERLTSCVRGSDTVSRQGGDEFVVLLSELRSVEDAAVSARRMLKAVAEAHSIDQHDLHVTMSIGVSVYPDDGEDAEALIKNADTAMYQAKENGRQSYQFFKPVMNVRAVERQSVEESLRRALKRQEFKLRYQPKIDLRTGAITGAEALVRWIHPTRGMVRASSFRLPKSAASFCQSAPGSFVRLARRRDFGWTRV